MRIHSTVPVLDLRSVLRAAKLVLPTYQTTDSHWNYYGAFIGYHEAISSLVTQLPDITAPPAEALTFTIQQRSGGDLALMLGQKSLELSWAEMMPQPPLEPLAIHTADAKSPPSREATVYTENPSKSRCLLLFHDSYGEYWRPYFGQSFRRVVFIWHRNWDYDLIEREHPDVIVDEILERYLYNDSARILRLREGDKKL